MKVRKILCPDQVEDQEEEALAAVAAEADLAEVAVAASAAEALAEVASEEDIITTITDRISVGVGALAVIITAAVALADFSE